MNTIVESCLLGVVQGMSEFLPISSSGHLTAIEQILGVSGTESLTRNVILHFATLLAVVVVFRREVIRLLSGFVGHPEGRRLLGLVLIAATPAGIAGLLLQDTVRTLPEDWPYSVPVCWLVTAGVLWSLRGRHDPADGQPIDVRSAMWIGAWQVLALLPGISRSGMTIAAALWLRRRRDDAASFSFLTSLPLIAGATLLEMKALVWGSSEVNIDWGPLLVGGAVAFLTGWVSLKILLALLKRGAFHLWAIYLVVVAGLFAGWLANQ